MTDDLHDLMQSPQRSSFFKTVHDVTRKMCADCEYLPICKGGCYYVSFAAQPTLGEIKGREQFCKGYYLVFDHIINHLKGEAQ